MQRKLQCLPILEVAGASRQTRERREMWSRRFCPGSIFICKVFCSIYSAAKYLCSIYSSAKYFVEYIHRQNIHVPYTHQQNLIFNISSERIPWTYNRQNRVKLKIFSYKSSFNVLRAKYTKYIIGTGRSNPKSLPTLNVHLIWERSWQIGLILLFWLMV